MLLINILFLYLSDNEYFEVLSYSNEICERHLHKISWDFQPRRPNLAFSDLVTGAIITSPQEINYLIVVCELQLYNIHVTDPQKVVRG